MYTRPTQTQLMNAPMLGDGWSATAYRVGNYAVKRYRKRADYAEHSVLEGERRLREAGIPVVPVIDHWVKGGRWHCVQPVVETPDKLDWSDEILSLAGTLDDEGSASLMSGFIGRAEKELWMLKSLKA